jgi:hypothetical protein
MTKSADGRTVFHWTGRGRERDTAALADAIVGANELFCNRDGVVVRLGKDGAPIPLNFTAFREMVEHSICGVRLVRNGAGWRKDYFTYRFDPPPGPDLRMGGRRPHPNAAEPDSDVLDKIYREELAWRLPKAET